MKDESKRFGLNAFKALGGSYAMARHLGEQLGLSQDQLTFEGAGDAGGPGEAGGADLRHRHRRQPRPGGGLGRPSARPPGGGVHAQGERRERLENIRAQGAQAEITDLNYDDAVRLADRMGREHGWTLIQDTAWPGYEEIPAWIIQGYTTIAQEIATRWRRRAGRSPPTCFSRRGVGSFAGAMLGSFAARWGKDCPVTCIVEPDRADCLYRSAKAGTITPVTGDLDSMMAGLCCGEPCTVSWPILQRGTAAFVSCGDEYAARGMRLLGRPEPGDPAIVSGESGAVGVGGAGRHPVRGGAGGPALDPGAQ